MKTKLELLVTDLYEKEYIAEDFQAIKFFRKDNLVFDTYAEEKAQWLLSYPIQAEANYSNVYTIAEALSQIGTTKFVEEDPADLGKYGLTVPAYKFEYKIDGKDYKLSLGNIDQDSGSYYATLNDENLVFLLPNTSFTFLDKPIEEIVNSFVYIVNIKDVNQMTVTLDGKTDISKIRANFEDDEESTYEFNGTLLKQADSADSDYISLFKKYYQGAIGLVVDKISVDAQPELKNPEVTIEYLLHTGEKTVVELVPTPDGVSFYAFKDGEYTGMTLRQKQLTDENNNGLRISGLKLTEALKERNK